MTELDNNKLAMLIVFAIAVVFAGMVFNLNRINEIETGMGITGMLSTSSTGTATLTASVASSTTISLVKSTINLGSLQPGEWNSSENSSYTHSGTAAMANWNSTNCTENITIQNDGSIQVDVEAYSGDQPTAGKGNFTGVGGCMTTNTCMMVRCAWVMANGTRGGNCTDAFKYYTALPVASGAASEIVRGLNYSDANDEAFIFFNVTVPEDEHARVFSMSVTFAATAHTA